MNETMLSRYQNKRITPSLRKMIFFLGWENSKLPRVKLVHIIPCLAV